MRGVNGNPHWLETWAELTEPNHSHRFGTIAAGNPITRTSGTKFQNMSGMGGLKGFDGNSTGTVLPKMHIPLQFWFCRNPGLALPLIALQYHEVKLNLTFGATTGVAAGTPTLAAKLFVDYIYLDTDERRRFAQVSHEYLIEQLQFINSSDGATHDLNFNHPVKELIWTGGVTATGTRIAGPSTPVAPSAGNYKLTLNGHDRFSERDITYFTRAQVWQHHTGVGGLTLDASDNPGNAAADSIAVYSFALNPEEHQPSGTCNFSRIDNAQLTFSNATTGQSVRIYAVNYNVLRIMSGMGGLAYSN